MNDAEAPGAVQKLETQKLLSQITPLTDIEED